jgi:hypothetical protein
MSEPFDTTVRLRLYREFVETGRAPSSARIAGALDAPVAEVRSAFERLATAKAIVLQPESRELLMASPLCAVPTPFVVRHADKSYFGACAWDALGIMAMLSADATLETSCPCCGEALSLESRGVIYFGVPARRWWDNIVFT